MQGGGSTVSEAQSLVVISCRSVFISKTSIAFSVAVYKNTKFGSFFTASELDCGKHIVYLVYLWVLVQCLAASPKLVVMCWYSPVKCLDALLNSLLLHCKGSTSWGVMLPGYHDALLPFFRVVEEALVLVYSALLPLKQAIFAKRLPSPACLDCPQSIFPEALRNIWLVLGTHETWLNISWQQWFPMCCPFMNTILVQCFSDSGHMNKDFQGLQNCLKVVWSYPLVLSHLFQDCQLCS